MTRVLLEQSSSAGGEISPYLAGRRDLARWQSSWAKVENFVPMPEGVLTRRPGTRFLGQARNSARPTVFIPFTFGDGDALMIAVNDGVMRLFSPSGAPVLREDGLPYELTHVWQDVDLPSLRWWQQGNLVYIVCPSRPPQVLTRYSAISWSLAPYASAGGPVGPMNQNRSIHVQCGATIGGAVTVTANDAIFAPGHVGGVWRVEEEVLSNVPAWSPNETVGLGEKRRYKGRIYAAVGPGSTGVNPPEHEFGNWRPVSGGVDWQFVSKGYGYFRITAWTSPNEVTVAVLDVIPDGAAFTPTTRWSPAAWDDTQGWPSCVHMHQQSLIFSRFDVSWMTKPGDFYDFDIPPTASEDSGNSWRMTSPVGAMIDIRYFISGVVLIAGTSIGEFIVRGASPSDRLTPTTLRDYLDTTEGCAAHRPARTDGGALFIGPTRKKLLFMGYDRLSERVEIKDLTRYARATLRKGVAEICYQRDPHRVVWLRLVDGSLASITFWPEEEFVALARHPAPGAVVEHIAALPSLDQSQTDVWMAVRRQVAGASRVYYEKTAPFFEPVAPAAPTAAGAWHLDCALAYAGPAATHLAGLSHLEGLTVWCNAGGRQVGPFTVTGGAIDLPFATTDCVVGLKVVAVAETLPRETQTQTGPTMGRRKSIPSAVIETFEALGLSACAVTPAGAETAEAVWPAGRTGPLETPALQSGAVRVDLDADTDRVVSIRIVADGVFPATLLGVHAELEVAA